MGICAFASLREARHISLKLSVLSLLILPQLSFRGLYTYYLQRNRGGDPKFIRSRRACRHFVLPFPRLYGVSTRKVVPMLRRALHCFLTLTGGQLWLWTQSGYIPARGPVITLSSKPYTFDGRKFWPRPAKIEQIRTLGPRK